MQSSRPPCPLVSLLLETWARIETRALPSLSLKLATRRRLLLRLLHTQRELNQRWRHVHAEYARHVNSAHGSLPSALPRGRMLLEMEETICELVRLRDALRRASADGYPSTGHAFITFERIEAADRRALSRPCHLPTSGVT